MTSTPPSRRFALISQPPRQESQHLTPVPPEQTLHVQHARTVLTPIPGRAVPPVHLPLRLPPELRQPQQAHRHPLRLTRPLDRVPGPCPALLPTQPLLQVPGPVLLPEPRREQLHHLKSGQLHRRGAQGEPLLVPLDLGDHRLDRYVVTRDPPQALHLLPGDLSPSAVDEGVPLVPRPGPAAAL